MPHAIAIKNSVDALKFMQVGATSMTLYTLLNKRPMTISELKAKTGLSERNLRIHLSDLLDRNFIKREILQGGRLMYEYSSNKPENIFDSIENKLHKLESARKYIHGGIIKGSRFHVKKG